MLDMNNEHNKKNKKCSKRGTPLHVRQVVLFYYFDYENNDKSLRLKKNNT